MTIQTYDWSIKLCKMALADQVEIDGDSRTVKLVTYKAPPAYFR